jgi:hypothetical protein
MLQKMLSVCHLLESVEWNGHYLSEVECLRSVGGVEAEIFVPFRDVQRRDHRTSDCPTS